MDARGASYRIGELARLSGVPVKTIRFYSDCGLLPPARVEASGYRFYADGDLARLALIRSLRELGIDLPTIQRLLRAEISAREVLALQLEVTEMQLRAARRQRALLRAALRAEGEPSATRLARLRTLARLDRLERERLLGARLERLFEGVAADPGWRDGFWQAAALDLPDELSGEQLEAWLELAELLADDDFIQRLNRLGREAWAGGRSGAWSGELSDLYGRAIEAMRAGQAPGGPRGRELAGAYVGLHAGAFADGPATPARLLALLERNAEPRAERYWELIGILRGAPEPSPVAEAHRWLLAALAALDGAAAE